MDFNRVARKDGVDVMKSRCVQRALHFARDITQFSLENQVLSGRLPRDMDPEEFANRIPEYQRQMVGAIVHDVENVLDNSLFLKMYPDDREIMAAAMLITAVSRENGFDENLLRGFSSQVLDPVDEVIGVNQVIDAGMGVDEEAIHGLSPHARILLVAQVSRDLAEMDLYMSPEYAKRTGYADNPNAARQKLQSLRELGMAACGCDMALDSLFRQQLEKTTQRLIAMELGDTASGRHVAGRAHRNPDALS